VLKTEIAPFIKLIFKTVIVTEFLRLFLLPFLAVIYYLVSRVSMPVVTDIVPRLHYLLFICCIITLIQQVRHFFISKNNSSKQKIFQ